jgi:predicted metalloprotease with PDZ domain
MKSFERVSVLAFLCAAVCFCTNDALAQPALERLEKKLQSEPLPPPPPEPLEKPAPKPLPKPKGRANPQAVGEPGYLGIVGDDRLERGRGIRVLETLPNGPALRGGLQEGDLIVRVNDKPVATMQDMGDRLKSTLAGDQVKFIVERRGVLYELTITLGRRPLAKDRQFRTLRPVDNPPRRERPMLLGVRTVPVSDQMRRILSLPTSQGALVSEVVKGSPAERAGIRPNTLLLAIDRNTVRAPADLASAVAAAGAGRTIAVLSYQFGRYQTRNIKLGGRPQREFVPPPEPKPPVVEPGERVKRLEKELAESKRRIAELEKLLQAKK